VVAALARKPLGDVLDLFGLEVVVPHQDSPRGLTIRKWTTA
jgi:hypothetical protein